MRARIDGWLDRLFPTELAVVSVPEFQAYKIKSTAVQLQVSLWLALLTWASFGMWDMFAANGGVVTTRFRFLVACPIVAMFAVATNFSWPDRHRELFVIVFSNTMVVLVFIVVILIDRELPFKIGTGNATNI